MSAVPWHSSQRHATRSVSPDATRSFGKICRCALNGPVRHRTATRVVSQQTQISADAHREQRNKKCFDRKNVEDIQTVSASDQLRPALQRLSFRVPGQWVAESIRLRPLHGFGQLLRRSQKRRRTDGVRRFPDSNVQRPQCRLIPLQMWRHSNGVVGRPTRWKHNRVVRR